MAGLNCQLMIEEPVAAAVYYIYGSLSSKTDAIPDNYRLLVFDCGGGITDISIIRIE